MRLAQIAVIKGQVEARQATAPSPLMAWSKDTTSAGLQWNNPGADSFVLERATQADYSDATEVYSGIDTDFEDSGLTIGTTYYYRVKAKVTGQTDSEWVTSSVSTIMAMPEFWYEMTGLEQNTDNEYGSLQNISIDSIKSVVNTSGLTLATQGSTLGTKGLLRYQTKGTPYCSMLPREVLYLAPSDYTFTADFLFAWKFLPVSTIANKVIVQKSTNYWIRWSNSTTLTININGSVYNITIPAMVFDKQWYNCILKREGTTLSLSLDGGETFPYTNTVSSSDFIFNEFFNSQAFLYQRFVGYNYIPSIQAIRQIFNYLSQPDYAESDATEINVTGVTWEPHSSDYIVNTSFAKNVLASIVRDRIINIGEYTIINGNTKTASPDFSNDFVVIKKRSTGEISDIKYLGLTNQIEDDHHNGSIFKDDNKIKHIELDRHYDYGPGTSQPPQTFVIKEFGNEFDFSSFTTRTIANGVSAYTGSSAQYPQYHRFSAARKAIICSHDFHPDGIGRYLPIFITTDNFNSFDKETVVDVGADYWKYLSLVYSPDGKLRVFVNVQHRAVDARQNMYDYICYIESADGLTWTNLAGDFSQDISNNNPIVLADLVTHCLVQDASTLTGNARMAWAFYDDSDGEIHGISSDGDDTGLVMIYSQAGNWILQPIDPGTKTLVYDFRIGNGDNTPVLIRTGPNSYDSYVHEENGGAWKIIRKHTDDKGVTWTNGEDFSSDPTSQHKRMHVNRDALYNDHITVGAARVVTDDNSDIFIKDAVGF